MTMCYLGFSFTQFVISESLSIMNLALSRVKGSVPFTYRFGCACHWLRKLVRKKSQQCSEGAQGSGEQNEERKFFFGIDRQLMMT